MAASSGNYSLFDTSSLEALKEIRVAIVSTEWNEAIVGSLIEGARRILDKFGATVTYDIKVPGAIELPYACRLMSKVTHSVPEAVIAFGAVIRGGTPHFDYVCDSVTQGLTALNTTGSTPIIFGVLTLDNEQQAWERLGGSHGHKGEEAALAALKMIALRRQLSN